MYGPRIRPILALLENPAGGRAAKCAYSIVAGIMTLNLDLNDGMAHQVAFYVCDWNNLGRAERIDVINPASGTTLATESLSNFVNGDYAVFNISGDVIVRITRTAGLNAVLSGVFLGGKPVDAAYNAPADTTTQGNWQGTYGTQGAIIIGNTVTLPNWAQFDLTSASLHTWNDTTTAATALQTTTGRIAAAAYSASSFNIDFSFSDGQAHRVALYLEDWDNLGLRGTHRRHQPKYRPDPRVADCRQFQYW